MKLFMKMLLPLCILFGVLSIVVICLSKFWKKFSVDEDVLLFANLLYLTVGILVFLIQKKALANANPNVFVRSIIAGMMIKMFSTVLAVLAYVVITGPEYSKNAVFFSLLMYLIYLGVEVYVLSKQNRSKHG